MGSTGLSTIVVVVLCAIGILLFGWIGLGILQTTATNDVPAARVGTTGGAAPAPGG